ncbi:nitroreductase family protein [Thalassolituus sp. LLYu03]|uniref:nitroreductase family protein n=1 Tax=Thalassolituus sp. LLYu03 TaxID=3421656 RepID=UPI003D2C32A8
MNVFDALTQRTSVNYFDTSRLVSRGTVLQLIDYAQKAPTAFNIQHTRYLVITDAESKAALKDIAYGQQKVADAPVIILVLADEQGHLLMPDIAQRGVDAGIYDNGVRDYLVGAVNNSYAANPAFAHDEALRSASMATMNLMTAATGLGLATGPMIGFDAQRLKEAFHIGERYTPAMMITLGYAREGNWPGKPRLAASEVAVLDVQAGAQHAFSV